MKVSRCALGRSPIFHRMPFSIFAYAIPEFSLCIAARSVTFLPIVNVLICVDGVMRPAQWISGVHEDLRCVKVYMEGMIALRNRYASCFIQNPLSAYFDESQGDLVMCLRSLCGVYKTGFSLWRGGQTTKRRAQDRGGPASAE